jgi:hypothetical protein
LWRVTRFYAPLVHLLVYFCASFHMPGFKVSGENMKVKIIITLIHGREVWQRSCEEQHQGTSFEGDGSDWSILVFRQRYTERRGWVVFGRSCIQI